MLPLGLDEIHLWLTYCDEIDNRLLATYRAFLSDDERLQELRFYFAADRRRYLVTRALVRTVLSKYAPIDPGQWRFTKNAYGRPAIEKPQLTIAPLRFNISHTTNLVTLGVAEGFEIGLDVEHTAPRGGSIDIAKAYFAPEEVEDLASLSAQHFTDRFFEYWTLKESYIKARGMGLSIPLNQFRFNLRQNKIELFVDQELKDIASRWQFWQLRPNPEHLIAVCAARATHSARRLVVKKSIPTLTEEPFAAAFLRTS